MEPAAAAAGQTLEEESSFRCSKCEKVFPSELILRNHLRSVHYETAVQLCGLCGKGFPTHLEVMHHVTNKHWKKSHPCPVCQRKLVTKEALNNHVDAAHRVVQISYDLDVDRISTMKVKRCEEEAKFSK